MIHRRWLEHAVALAVTAVSIWIALDTWHQFIDHPRSHWSPIHHDRNAHYAHALRLALDARAGDWPLFALDLDRARQWPPLHALAAATAIGIAGIGHDHAVLPSLVAWAGCIVLAFGVARRCVPAGGTLAGSVAALLVIASPAYRALATDVMLESIGALLTLVVVWGYVCASQTDRVGAWRTVAGALSLLLITKYNYWLLAIVALAASLVWRHPASVLALARQVAAVIRAPGWIRTQLRQPLTWVMACAVGIALAMPFVGHQEFEIAGIEIEIRSLAEPLNIAWIALVLRVLPDAFRQRSRLRQIDPRWRAFMLWHLLPFTIFALLPTRLGNLMGYVSPIHTRIPWPGLSSGFEFYAEAFATGYHASTPLWLATAIGVVVGLGAMRWLRPGAEIVWMLLGIGCVLTIVHPNHQQRFVHTWIAAAWVLSGCGAAWLVGFRDRTRVWMPRIAASAAAVGLLWLAAPHLRSTGPPGGIPHRPNSTLDLTDAYLPALDGFDRVLFVGNLPLDYVTEWSLLERRLERESFAGFIHLDGDPEGWSERVARALDRQSADALVVIDIAPESPLSWENTPAESRFATRFATRFDTRFDTRSTSGAAFHRVEFIELAELDATASIYARPPDGL